MATEKKTVHVTINQIISLADAADAYGQTNFADYSKGDNTATAAFSKAGEGFDLTTELTGVDNNKKVTGKYTIGTITDAKYADGTAVSGFELKDYFNVKTGAVLKLQAKDITMTVPLVFNPTVANTNITVTTTIKAAAGEEDLAKLEKEYRAAEEVVLEKITELSAAEGKLTVAQLNELYKAYKPYKEAKAAYYAAKGE